MTVIGYPRVSTTDQNLDRQIAELKAAGCEVIEPEKISGAKPLRDRPVFNGLLRRMKRGDTLVVTSLDRLGRSVVDLLAILASLKESGIELRVLNMGIDTGTPAGKMFFVFTAALAEVERDLIRERVNSGLAASSKKGGKPTVLTPEVLTHIRRAVDRGLGTREIAKETGVSPASVKRGYQLLTIPSARRSELRASGGKNGSVKKVPDGTCADGIAAQ